MTSWYSKALGDGIEAFEPTTEIQNRFMALALSQTRLGQYSSDAAVFSGYDSATNVVTVYFTPSAELLATALGASPCPKPVPTEGFGLIVGDARAWEAHFPGFLEERRSVRRS